MYGISKSFHHSLARNTQSASTSHGWYPGWDRLSRVDSGGAVDSDHGGERRDGIGDIVRAMPKGPHARRKDL